MQDVTTEELERMRKRQAAAERRHAGAIEALARVRRLLPASMKPTPRTEDSRADPEVVDGEPIDVVPFEPAPRRRKSSRRAASASGEGIRQVGDPGHA